jgi:hypothetical protein
VCSATCTRQPESTAAFCNNLLDDDLDGTTDCEDTTTCSAIAECATTGTAAAGTACTAASACASSATDPGCITEAEWGWPGGSCAEHCSTADACPAGSDCLTISDGTDVCLETCNDTGTAADCARGGAGYDCVDIGSFFSFYVCLPNCTADGQCTGVGRCDLEQNLCRPAEAGTCADLVDTDRDGDRNCGDVECIGDAACAAFALTETEPNETSAMANVYAPARRAAIGMAMDVDMVSVTVLAGQTLTATVTDFGTGGCLRPALDSYVEILGTDGTTVLAENEDISVYDWCSSASATIATAGTYFVRVRSSDYAPTDTFVYGLDVTLTGP